MAVDAAYGVFRLGFGFTMLMHGLARFLDGINTVAAPNPCTVLLKLKSRFSPIVENFFGGDSNYPILAAHLLAQYASLDRVAYNAAPIGSGFYRFARWVRGDRLEMSANPRYYAERPAIARIRLRFIHDGGREKKRYAI
ncbi:MAG: ABC transporter substrate-binding protein [Candidatus Cybelea sp.]